MEVSPSSPISRDEGFFVLEILKYDPIYHLRLVTLRLIFTEMTVTPNDDLDQRKTSICTTYLYDASSKFPPVLLCHGSSWVMQGFFAFGVE